MAWSNPTAIGGFSVLVNGNSGREKVINTGTFELAGHIIDSGHCPEEEMAEK